MLNKLKKILLLKLERILRNWADAILKLVTIPPSVDEISNDSVNGEAVLDMPGEQEPRNSKETNYVAAENINKELMSRPIVTFSNTVDLEIMPQSAADVNESSVTPTSLQSPVNDSGAATRGVVATEKERDIKPFLNETVREMVGAGYGQVKTQKDKYKIENYITDGGIQYQPAAYNKHEIQQHYSLLATGHSDDDGYKAASLTLSIVKREKYNAFYAEFYNEKNIFDKSDVCIDEPQEKINFTRNIAEHVQHIPASIVKGNFYIAEKSISESGIKTDPGARHWPELGESAPIIHINDGHNSSGNVQHWPEFPLMDQVIDTAYVHEMSHADYYRELMHRRELDMEQQGQVWNA